MCLAGMTSLLVAEDEPEQDIGSADYTSILSTAVKPDQPPPNRSDDKTRRQSGSDITTTTTDLTRRRHTLLPRMSPQLCACVSVERKKEKKKSVENPGVFLKPSPVVFLWVSLGFGLNLDFLKGPT